MTIDDAVADLRKVIGSDWPKMMPLPETAVIALCEALWVGGKRPNHRRSPPISRVYQPDHSLTESRHGATFAGSNRKRDIRRSVPSKISFLT